MKTTSLEQLMKVDLLLQVQEQYSKSTIKRSDKLDKRIRLFQKRLLDNKLKEELNFIPAPERQEDDLLAAFYGIEHNIFDSYTEINGYRSSKPSSKMEEFNYKIKSIDDEISRYEQEIEIHKKDKEDWKSFVKLKNKYYQRNEVNAHMAGISEGPPASFNEIRNIKILLKTVTNFKDYLYSLNRMWNAKLEYDEGIFGIFEGMENRREYDELHPFERIFKEIKPQGQKNSII